MEGVSLLPAFAGQPLDAQEPIFWEHEGNRAVRAGKWKLVLEAPRAVGAVRHGGRPHRAAQSHRRRAGARGKDLIAKWEAWAKRADVGPWPGPGRATGAMSRVVARHPLRHNRRIGVFRRSATPSQDTAAVDGPVQCGRRALRC